MIYLTEWNQQIAKANPPDKIAQTYSNPKVPFPWFLSIQTIW